MHSSHLKALQNKHERLEKNIHHESNRAARNDVIIDRLKKEKLHLKEEIERVKNASG